LDFLKLCGYLQPEEKVRSLMPLPRKMRIPVGSDLMLRVPEAAIEDRTERIILQRRIEPASKQLRERGHRDICQRYDKYEIDDDVDEQKWGRIDYRAKKGEGESADDVCGKECDYGHLPSRRSRSGHPRY
jgi:hypothetical protein